MVGSITQEREITVTDSEVNIGKIELAEDSKLLQEVVVTGQKARCLLKLIVRYLM